MHSIRQKCRPKHQVLILKCYPRTVKGAVDVRPNSSELNYLLFYATTRRSKVAKVGAFLEKKTASDIWRTRTGNVQVTLQILTALIDKAPRDLPLCTPSILNVIGQVLRSRDIAMVEASIPTFAAFCEHHDGSSLATDPEYLARYAEIVQAYTAFASIKTSETSAPLRIRWRNVGLEAIRSVTSAEALASVAGRQLQVIMPVLLENLWSEEPGHLETLDRRMQMDEPSETPRIGKRRGSSATVQTMDAVAVGTTADADKMAEQNTAMLAMQCLKQIFASNNRSQIYNATKEVLGFVEARIEKAQGTPWTLRIFGVIARWTPVQDRFVILVVTMDTMVHLALVEARMPQHLILACIIDSLLDSDVNLIGLSVMDILLGLIQHVLRVFQLPHADALSIKLQSCISHLANHVYYADQISDMVSAILMRIRSTSDDPACFSSDVAKVKALEAVKSIIMSAKPGRHRVPLRVWEGTHWLLRDPHTPVRRAYVDVLLVWMDKETTRSDLRLRQDRERDAVPKRAVSNAPRKEKSKEAKETFLPLLHLAIYENAHQYVEDEDELVMLHLLLCKLVASLGVNAAKFGIPMIYRLQEDILEVESPRAKIFIGSLCHGYFWMLSETFDFESSSVGRILQTEIIRRRKKDFWVHKISVPPMSIAQLAVTESKVPGLPQEVVESESLKPFDERFLMVKLISLSYAESVLASPAVSPAVSPARFQPSSRLSKPLEEKSMSESVKEQMMADWTREIVLARLQETSKSTSLNDSRSRGLLAISGSNSPRDHGSISRLRKTSTPTSSQTTSVTRVEQLKNVLSGVVVSDDSSSESMVSYNMTASELSFNGNPSPRSRSVDPEGLGLRPLASHPIHTGIPPVPPLPEKPKSRTHGSSVDLRGLVLGIDSGRE